MIKNKRVLARVLMRDILTVLQPEDFNLIAFDVADNFKHSKCLPHLNIPSNKLFDMFYNKVSDNLKYILDNYSDIIIKENRMLTLKEATALSLYYKEMENKKHGKTTKSD